MIVLPVVFDLDKDSVWPELAKLNDLNRVTYSREMQIGILEAGTIEGNPTVFVRIDGIDGTVILGETSARAFLAAAQVIRAKYYPNLG